MSNELFSNNESDSNNQTELSGEDSLKLLVGEGKKYATVEELAKGMVHGQNHITTLENEATTLKDKQAKQSTIEDVLAAIKAGDNNNQQSDDNQQQADQHASDTNQPVDITQQIKSALDERATSDNATANVQKVTASLSTSLGDRANEVYTRVGRDLGVNLDKLSKTSPDAVIRLCTGQQQQASQQNSLPASTVHTTHTSVGGELDYQGIQVLYKKGGMSIDQKFRLEQQQAQLLGSKFFNKQ